MSWLGTTLVSAVLDELALDEGDELRPRHSVQFDALAAGRLASTA